MPMQIPVYICPHHQTLKMKAQTVSETFETQYTLKCLIAREKLITLKLTYRLQILLAGTTKVRTL